MGSKTQMGSKPTEFRPDQLRHGEDAIPNYINPDWFSVKVHHGGCFMVEGNVKSYVGGKISYSDYENRCQFSLIELDGIGKNLGFKDYVEYYFKVPTSQGEFKIIQTHDQVMDMLNHIKDNVIDIYIGLPNSLVDDLQEVDVANWEWEIGTFPESGVTIQDVDIFVEGCRPLIGVDGCFLKGHNLGQLLTAVGIDANDQTFPVAYAIVEQENTSTWTWFLGHLIPDLEIVNEPTWTIISDKQKGLENAMKELLPNVEHRHCVKHLHANFKNAGFPGQVLHDKMWELARASYEGKFDFLMGELQKDDPGAFAWLSHPTRDPCHWSRSHFIVTPKCDILVNNLCEPFNKAILCARDKPILTLLERLRTYLMDRVVKKREFTNKWVDDLGPKIHKKIEKIKNKYGDYIVYPCGEGEFEARGIDGGQYTVNLPQQTCSCRRWDLTGIPCEHAARVIVESGGEPEEYVSDWYSKHSYLTSYGNIMHPMNGPDMWEKSGKDPIRPAEYVKPAGRPRKARRRGADEPTKQPFKLSKRGVKMNCRKCGKEGHNSRTCTSTVNTTNPTPRSNTNTNTRGGGQGRSQGRGQGRSHGRGQGRGRGGRGRGKG